MRLFYFSCAVAVLSAACVNMNPGFSSGDSDEESARQFQKDETYEQIRAGARLVLTYDAGANAFIGTVENITSRTLARVRVEVHLSNGTELGPTTPVDLASGQIIAVSLGATSAPFATWSAHPEVEGSGREHSDEGGEHSGEGGESGGEHSGGGGGEHSGRDEGTGGSDEESARQFQKDETCDQIRAGARLVLAYDAGANTFIGTVENTTSRTLT